MRNQNIFCRAIMIVWGLSFCGLPVTSCMAGHFACAFQRQMSAWENSAGTGCLGGHVCRVWVWDEAGKPIPNIQFYTTWGVLMGATDIDGRAEIPIWADDYNLMCVDGHGSTSDATRLMTTHRPECWGHYSFEVGFLYKTDVSNPGEFDLDMNCTWNERAPAPQDNDAPYTKSLAYSGVDCTDYWSDQSYWGNWQNPPSYFGQTFIATGNRVIAARVQGTIGGLGLLDWKLRIVTFPALQPVGPDTSVPVRWPFGWEAFWGVNDCPVVPGQKYMLQVWRDGDGMNIYHITDDVYPDGKYYEGTTPFPQFDLNGHICCMNYSRPSILYVDADIGIVGDGTSWADAFNNLQDALAAALTGDEIRVAQGVYKPARYNPHQPPPPPQPPGGSSSEQAAPAVIDREATFQLKNGVVIKGGYVGFGEPDPNARDIGTYKTILSGDIAGNDGPDFTNNGENSYHVVTGSDCNESAVLDGFTITAGFANGGGNNDNGGGMVNSGGKPTLINCAFTDNYARGSGGGMNNWSSSPTVTNCTFNDNHAENGGGMYNYRSSPNVTNCTFSDNSCRNGGGMFNDSGSPNVTNCTFSGNSADYGGGMKNWSSSPTVTNCMFTGNSADGGGGMGNYNSNPTLTNCTFSGNSASGSGSGMYNRMSHPTVTNCIFSGNSAGWNGGGMYNHNNSSPTVTNCTFSGNSAGNFGGGMYNYESSQILTNCILWDDRPEEVYLAMGATAVITYSDVQGGWPGIGNINSDPLFADSANSDYHLLTGSPCINTGDPDYVDEPNERDLDGNPRLIGGRIDMGAYEGSYQEFLLNAESVVVLEGGTATFTVAPKIDPLGTLEVTVAVESGDPDITVESGGLLTFDSTNYSQPQTVTLAAAEDGDQVHGTTVILVSAPGVYPAGVTAYELDSEAPTELYVDCDALGANDGSNWENAFTELREGLSFAAGTFWVKEIRVAQGVYKPARYNPHQPPPPPPPPPPGGSSSDQEVDIMADDREATFQLKNGVVIKGGYAGFGQPDPNARDIDTYKTILSGDIAGNDGPDFTNNGENSYHVVTGSDCNESAVLDGFTITAGNANGVNPKDRGGGMYNEYGNPTILNCTFTRNSAVQTGGGICNNISSSPTLTNCMFSGNSAQGLGGGMFNRKSSSPTVTNCTFSGNLAARGGGIYNFMVSSPTLTNCTFTGNSSAHYGGGIFNKDGGSPTLTNCTFNANSSEWYGGGMDNSNSSPTLTNCTFTANSARNGSALACHSYEQSSPSSLRLTNCILWDGGDEILNNDNSVITITYSDVHGGWPGTGNINANPLFVDSAIGDYHLLPSSPCINTGDPSYVAEPNEKDLDGKPRVIGDRIDMGAYEFNHIPVADAGPNQIVEAQGSWGATVTLDASGSSDADSTPGTNDDINDFDWYKVDNSDPNIEDFLGSGQIIDCNLSFGEHIIILEVIDRAGAFGVNEVTIIVQDTTPPVIICPADVTLECPADTSVGANGSATAGDVCGTVTVTHSDQWQPACGSAGTLKRTWTATDECGNSSSCAQTITVVDTTPPEFVFSVTPTVLWPPTHKMVLITPTWTASDKCDASPDILLVSIVMNEDDNIIGDGHTTNDIRVDDDGSIYLRAERSGTGSDRIYSITYQAVDDSGNAAVRSATVTVPHDQR